MATDSPLEIYCPRCQWEPDGGAHWQCHCGCVWNTFDTAAVCPRCRHRHRRTVCPAEAGGCDGVSLHVDWYHDLAGLVAELVEEALPAPAAVRCPSA